MKEELERLGGKSVVGDDCLYYFHFNGSLAGLAVVHVDDFFTAGTEQFRQEVTDKLHKTFKCSKREKNVFRFTGIDVNREENGDILISQNQFAESLEEIDINKTRKDPSSPLDREEYKKFRGAIGKLSWIAEQSNPSIAFDTLELSFHNKKATVADLKKTNKIIRKAKQSKDVVRFSKIGKYESLKILAISDGSYCKLENKVRSVSGKFVFLTISEETIVAPIIWKSKTISQVCKSAKSSETRSLDKTIDDAIYCARTLAEIYTGSRGEAQIPVVCVTDSQSLLDSIHSSKQIEEKLMRQLIGWFKQCLASHWIDEFRWCDTRSCLADMLTKAGSPLTNVVRQILRTSEFIVLKRDRNLNTAV